MADSQITIIGLGTTGTSLGLALKGALKDVRLVGHDREASAAAAARKAGAVDRTDWNLPASVEQAGLVILALPLDQIHETLAVIGPVVPAGCLVTDTASTKVPVLAWAKELLPPQVHFVGGDPIGVHGKAGEPAADLFARTTYCLCPDAGTPAEAIDHAAGLATAVGATPYFLDAAEHDGLVAVLDQLPFIMSAAALRAASASGGWRELAKLGGARFDRLLALLGNISVGELESARSNAANVCRWLDSLEEALHDLRALLASDQAEAGQEMLKHLNAARAFWERHEADTPPSAPDAKNNGIRRMLLGF